MVFCVMNCVYRCLQGSKKNLCCVAKKSAAYLYQLLLDPAAPPEGGFAIPTSQAPRVGPVMAQGGASSDRALPRFRQLTPPPRFPPAPNWPSPPTAASSSVAALASHAGTSPMGDDFIHDVIDDNRGFKICQCWIGPILATDECFPFIGVQAI